MQENAKNTILHDGKSKDYWSNRDLQMSALPRATGAAEDYLERLSPSYLTLLQKQKQHLLEETAGHKKTKEDLARALETLSRVQVQLAELEVEKELEELPQIDATDELTAWREKSLVSLNSTLSDKSSS